MQKDKSAQGASQSRIEIKPRFSLNSESSREPAGTFARAIMVEAPGYTERRAAHSVISLIVHVSAIAVLLISPLFPSTDPTLTMFNREIVTIPIAPAKEPPHIRTRTMPLPTRSVLSSINLLPPVFRAARIATGALAPSPPGVPFKPAMSGVTDGTGNVLGGILHETPVPFVDPAEYTRARIVEGSKITNARPVYKFSLLYPPLARAAHIFGNVVIRAAIDETGKVTNVRVITGPFLLSWAAMNALSQQRFEPMLLDGEPIKSELIVNVNFRLEGL